MESAFANWLLEQESDLRSLVYEARLNPILHSNKWVRREGFDPPLPKELVSKTSVSAVPPAADKSFLIKPTIPGFRNLAAKERIELSCHP